MYTIDAATAHASSQSQIESLRRFLKRHYANKQALAFGKPIRPISKQAKHNAYGDADYLIRHLRLDVPRAHNVEGLEAVLTAAVRWTPAQYDAAAERESIADGASTVKHLRFTAERIAALGFDPAAILAAADELAAQVEARQEVQA